MRKLLRSISRTLDPDTKTSGAQPPKSTTKRKLNEQLTGLFNKGSKKRSQIHAKEASDDSTKTQTTAATQSDEGLIHTPAPPPGDSMGFPSRVSSNDVSEETRMSTSTVKAVTDVTSPLSQPKTEHKSCSPRTSTTPPPRIIVDATHLAELPGNSIFADHGPSTTFEQTSSRTSDIESAAQCVTGMSPSPSKPTSIPAPAVTDAEKDTHRNDSSLDGSIKSPKRHQRDKSGDSGYKSGGRSRTPTPPEEKLSGLPSIVADSAPEQWSESITSPLSRDIPGPLCVSNTGPPLNPRDEQQGVLEWELWWEWEAKWLVDPDVEMIKEVVQPYAHLCGLPDQEISVTFFAKGAWNKVYTISAFDPNHNVLRECIFRVALPVVPWYKVQSDVATMEFIRLKTTIPVPRIYAFDSSSNNKLGLEWILMEKMDGKQYKDAEWTMDYDAKLRLIRTVADWHDQLSRLTFDTIGSLYYSWSQSPIRQENFQLGPILYQDWMPDYRLDYKVYRGPFSSLEQFYGSMINMHLAEILDVRQKQRCDYWAAQEENKAIANGQSMTSANANVPHVKPTSQSSTCNGLNTDSTAVAHSDLSNGSEDRPEKMPETMYQPKHFERYPKICLALQSILPLVHGLECFRPGSTFLCHQDVSVENILVDETGLPVALLDWEQISTEPYSRVYGYPRILDLGYDDEEEIQEPPTWTEYGPKTEWRVEQELKWERVLLRKEFRKRLEERESPYLQAFDEKDEDAENLRMRLEDFRAWSENYDLVESLERKHKLRFCKGE